MHVGPRQKLSVMEKHTCAELVESSDDKSEFNLEQGGAAARAQIQEIIMSWWKSIFFHETYY